MRVHANAKLGPAGRLALVRLIGEGARSAGRGAASVVSVGDGASVVASLAEALRREQRVAGVGADRTLAAAALAAAADARRAASGSASARERTNLGPGRLAGLLGRARSTIYKVLARHGLSRRRRGAAPDAHAATNGSSPARCCTWTSSAWRASIGPGTGRPAASAASSSATAAPAGSTCTSSSTTTPATSTSSSTPREDAETNARTLERALAHFAELGLRPARGGDDRQRQGLRHRTASRRPGRRRRPPHHPRRPTRRAGTARSSASSAPSKTNGPTPHRWPNCHHARPRPVIVRSLLQPQAAPQQPRRPATHQPRSQRPWAGHLDAAREARVPSAFADRRRPPARPPSAPPVTSSACSQPQVRRGRCRPHAGLADELVAERSRSSATAAGRAARRAGPLRLHPARRVPQGRASPYGGSGPSARSARLARREAGSPALRIR